MTQSTYQQIFDAIVQFSSQEIVFTPNPEILLKAKNDTAFRDILNKATYLTIDWIGLYIAFQINDSGYSKLVDFLLFPYYIFNVFFRKSYLYWRYGERVCGSDLTWSLLEYAQQHQVKITIVDPYFPQDLAKCESQKRFREKLQQRFPQLQFDYFIYINSDKDKIIEQIKNSQSRILFSTLGMKTQEESVVEIMDKCYNIKLGLGVWGSFDHFIGFQKRAPKLWRNMWLEWLYRLFTGPQKLKRLQRLWNAIFVFTWEVLKYK